MARLSGELGAARQMASLLCEALGLDPNDVMDLTVRFTGKEPMHLYVDIMPKDHAINRLGESISGRFKVVDLAESPDERAERERREYDVSQLRFWNDVTRDAYYKIYKAPPPGVVDDDIIISPSGLPFTKETSSAR